MTREEAHTLLEVMAIELTGELANSERPVTERTKLLGKQLKALDMAIEALSAEAETVDCTDFIRWLTETVMDDGMWELNAVAYGEVIARKLTKLGVLEVKDDVYVYEPSAEAVQGAGRYENAMQKLREMPRYLNGVKAKQIKKIPPEAVQGWIPISEGLPEEHEWVGTKKFGTTISDKVHITFDVNGERFVKTLSLQNGELSNYDKRTMDTIHKGWKMIAWMPLPKPYKGGDDE